MKGFILASFLVVAVSASSLFQQDGAKFQAFKLQHGKTYKNQAEEASRFAIFRDNLRSIESHNARFEQGLETYTQGINQFADMTDAEFKAMLALQYANKPNFNDNSKFQLPEGASAPDSIDWREKNVVGPIKNQASCGSCWAFALVGSTESALALKTGNVTSLSEQQLIDCTTDINFGCSGGMLEPTFPYIQQNGLESEADYPYQGEDGNCTYDSSKVVTKITSYVYFNGSEEVLKEAVGTAGPVVVGIDADYMKYYSNGIFTESGCPQDSASLDHAVLVIGYGSEDGSDYWIIKNSWGTAWGESGFIRFARGVNQCGIITENTYPII
ncbi:cathepsin L-like proteinase [Sitophilus oryzae]|uniref:Cathepsin L-like proteinase n=1 Tax=Sitophilus oryzae TaxID=7048 RepID=A0A6J2XEM2_SITOR|nr:cathepsin L-like proteinase [Sitophilus oryzae]